MTDEFLTADEAAKRLGVTRRTLEDWTRRYNLPHMKIGGKTVRYDWNDLQKAIKEQFEINRTKGLNTATEGRMAEALGEQNLSKPKASEQSSASAVPLKMSVVEILGSPIQILRLTPMVESSLIANGIGIVAALVVMTPQKLLRFRSVGDAALSSIKTALGNFGLALEMKIECDIPAK